jgi:hypothetical protein
LALSATVSADDRVFCPEPMVHHLVLFRFRADLPPETVPRVFAQLRALKDHIPGITGFSGGADCSKEGLTRGFTHGFCMTFEDAAARDAYLPHPEHQRLVEQLVPMLEGGIEGALTFDFQDGVI